MQNAECRNVTEPNSAFCILHSAFDRIAMAQETPIHEVRPTTQEMKIPARFIPQPVLEPGHTYASVTDHISSIVLRRKMPFGWYIGFMVGCFGVMLLTATIGKLIFVGVGIWGINHPVGWGFDILNFVWWIGIGHAGTLISAILLLLRQEWRTSINRFAEAMTLFAVASPGLSTPLVLSVHTIVSFDFAVAQVPGWHSTFFPPYFVAGAVYAGFAMVLTLAIPFRKLFHLEDFITMKHLENMGKVMLATGLIVFYAYAMEAFFAYYSANAFERYTWVNRAFGPYWKMYWMLILCNGLAPQMMWFRRIRTSA